jgi:hypothetical protein
VTWLGSRSDNRVLTRVGIALIAGEALCFPVQALSHGLVYDLTFVYLGHVVLYLLVLYLLALRDFRVAQAWLIEMIERLANRE